MVYKYEMYFNDIWNDVTPYVATNSTIGDRLDRTLNIGSFIFSHITSNKISGIDLSVAIKPWIPVKITIDSDVFRFYTSDCARMIVKKDSPKLYRHEINLIEVTKILQRKTLPDITVTQPKSQQFTALHVSDYKNTAVEIIRNTPVSPNLTLINQSNNTTLVEDNVIKANAGDGQVLLTLDIQNFQYNKGLDWDKLWWSHYVEDGDVDLTAEIYVNGVLSKTETFNISETTVSLGGNWYDITRPKIVDTPVTYVKSVYLEVPSSVIDQTITVKLYTSGTWNWYSYTLPLPPNEIYEDKVSVTTKLSIGAGDAEAIAYTYLSELATKCIRALNTRDLNDSSASSYRLDPSVEALLKGPDPNNLSPEFTFTNYKAWDALEKIANVKNAVPEIKDDFKTITFRYLDEIPDMYYDQDMFEDETLAYTLDEHVDGLEINAANLVEEDIMLNAKVEPYEGGWSSVRTSENLVGQLTDDNSVFKTRQPIQKIYNILIKGVGVKITDGNTTQTLFGNSDTLTNTSSSSYWDITSRVLTNNEWNVLENTTANNTDNQRRGRRTKGNNIYYTQGTNLIEGLGYKTLTVSDIIGTTNAPRALLETIMSKCAEYLSTNPTYAGWNVVTATDTNPEIALQVPHNNYEGILYRVSYVPLTNARTTVYKHNAFESNSFLTDYINEQDKLNDTVNLGKFVSSTLNRQGNQQYTVSGKTVNYGSIPKLGFRTYNDLVVSARDLNLNKNLITYTLQLSKEFINQSSFVGRSSAYRAFEIPSTDIVHRQDKYTNFIVLTKDINNVIPKGYSILQPYGLKMLTQNFCNLAGYTLSPLSYAKVDIVENKLDTPKSYDMPVNAYTLGTTVNMQMEFDTNYSAGSKVTDVIINGEDAKLQEYIQYTNTFGNIYSMKSTLYPTGNLSGNSTDADAYPEYVNTAPTGTEAIILDILADKDSREKYGINIELPFISDDSSTLRTYPGIAKYNGLVREKDSIDVGVALLDSGYFPTVNETKLNTGRTKTIGDTDGTSVYNFDNDVYGIRFIDLLIPANLRYEGYVVYEKSTKELIYAVKEPLAPQITSYSYDTAIVWFVPKKDLKDNTRPTE